MIYVSKMQDMCIGIVLILAKKSKKDHKMNQLTRKVNKIKFKYFIET